VKSERWRYVSDIRPQTEMHVCRTGLSDNGGSRLLVDVRVDVVESRGGGMGRRLGIQITERNMDL